MKIINWIFKIIAFIYCIGIIMIQAMGLLILYSYEISNGKMDLFTYVPLNIVLLIFDLYFLFKNTVDIHKKNFLIFTLGIITILNPYVYTNYINKGSFNNQQIFIGTVLPVLLIYLSSIINYSLYKKSNNK